MTSFIRATLAGLLAPVGVAIAVTFPGLISAQVPTRSSVPRLVVPVTEAPAQPTPGQPTAAPAPDATAPTAAASPDTTPPAGAPLTQVTGTASGVTTVGAGGTPAISSSAQAATAATRSYGAARFSLLLEGAPVGFVRSLEGGTVVANVAIEREGGGIGGKKGLSGTKVEEISAQVGLDAKTVMDWIAQSWTGNYQRKSGSIVLMDLNNKAVSGRQFTDGLIAETTVPAISASSKEQGYFTVKILPQTVQWSKGDGASIKDASISPKQKAWLVSNFRFDMDGLDGSAVAQIASFTVRQPGAPAGVGAAQQVKQAGGVEFPNISLSIQQGKSDTWANWYNDFVVSGNNDDQHEKNGAIVFLTADQKTELGRISLFNCGIFRFAPDKYESGMDKAGLVTAELYCERMELANK